MPPCNFCKAFVQLDLSVGISATTHQCGRPNIRHKNWGVTKPVLIQDPSRHALRLPRPDSVRPWLFSWKSTPSLETTPRGCSGRDSLEEWQQGPSHRGSGSPSQLSCTLVHSSSIITPFPLPTAGLGATSHPCFLPHTQGSFNSARFGIYPWGTTFPFLSREAPVYPYLIFLIFKPGFCTCF